MDTRSGFVIFIIVVTVPFGQVSSMEIDEKCKVVKSLLQQYQTQCIFLLKAKDDQDMGTELLSFKYFNEFSRNFYVSSMIRGKWKNPISREICQPFVFAFYNVSHLDTILEIFANSTYRANAKSVVFGDSVPNHEEFFNDTYIAFDTEFLLAKEQFDKKGVTTVDEFYHILPNTSLRTQTVGQWHSEIGLKWRNKSYSERRNNFHGTELKAAFFPFVKIIYVMEYKDNKPTKFGGYVFHIWDALQKALNFTTNFQRVTKGGFGVRDANGTWNGITGILERKVVDAGLLTLVMTPSRLSVMDYFVPVKKSRLLIFLKRDHTDSTLDQLLKPLSDNLWIAVGFTIILVSILLTVARVCSVSTRQKTSDVKLSVSNSIFYVFGIFCQTAPKEVPDAWPTRLVIINASVIGFIVHLAYSAMLFSFLAVSKYEIPLKNLKELTDDGRYKLGLLQNSADFLYFSESKDPIMIEAYRKLVLAEKNHPTGIDEGLRRICERQRYAYMVMNLYEKQIRPDLGLSCTYVALPHFSIPASFGIACTKNSPLKRIINYNIIKMYEGGLLKILYDRLEPLKFRGELEEDVTTVASLEKVTIIFIIFLAGILSSTMIMLIEICYHRVMVTP